MKRNTPQRQIILNAMRSLANHPTVEQVYAHVVQTHPSISKATVYRNLAAAAEADEIAALGTVDGAMHFDHNTEKHFHFVCDCCKTLIDVPWVELPSQLTLLQGLTIKKVELTLRGLCEGCACANNKRSST
ncbi:MAG: transcriptional repressor [Oscillospiraceae bacterium]|nr:transcriptional repressor [Oscillospiraceae bacterium]